MNKQNANVVTYVTRNSEYDVKDGVCVAVRSRWPGKTFTMHAALKARLETSVKLEANGAMMPKAQLEIGDHLYFVGHDATTTITSPISEIKHPGDRAHLRLVS